MYLSVATRYPRLVPAMSWIRYRLDLGQPPVVAERVAETGVDAVEPLRGLLDELHAPGLELLVALVAVVGDEPAHAEPALGQQVAHRRGGGLVDQRRTGHVEHDLHVGLVGRE